MRPTKRSLAAKARHRQKRRRTDTGASEAEDTYLPSDSDTSDSDTIDDTAGVAPTLSESTRNAIVEAILYAESEFDESSSDSCADLAGLDEDVDENDWQPGLAPVDIEYSIFTNKKHSFKSAGTSLRGVYKRDSRTTNWRKKRVEEQRAIEAKSCRGIRAFFKPVGGPGAKKNNIREEKLNDSPGAIEAVTILDSESDVDTAPHDSGTETDDIADLGGQMPNFEASCLFEPLAALSVLSRSHSPTLSDAFGSQDQPNKLEDPVVNHPPVPNHLSDNSSPPPVDAAFAVDLEASEPAQGQQYAKRQRFTRAQRVHTRMQVLRTKLRALLEEQKSRKGREKGRLSEHDTHDIQALLDYSVAVSRLCLKGHSSPETISSLEIARCKIASMSPDGDAVSKGAWYARTLRQKAAHVYKTGQLPERRQGKGAAHASLFENPEVRKAIDEYIDSTKRGKVSPASLVRHMNAVVLPSLSTAKKSVSEVTAKKWLTKLGFKRRTHRKGVYMDGHERPDVIEYRNEFLDKVALLEKRMQRYSDQVCEPLPLKIGVGEKQLYAAFHDECIFRANDQQADAWLRENEHLLRQKGGGRLIHVLDFVIEGTSSGRIKLSDAEIEKQNQLPPEERLPAYDARKIIYPVKGGDAYWDMPQLIEQVKVALKIFEAKFPDGQLVMFFDQSSSHNAYAHDALNAHKMNVGPGGKQPKMRDTVIPEDNPNPELRGKVQSMVYPPGHAREGEPKGMEAVVRERGLWDSLESARNGKKPVGRCKRCKMNAAEQEKLLTEAKAAMEKDPDLYASIDDAIDAISDRRAASSQSQGISNTETVRSHAQRFCCMEKCLATEKDFMAEKPLLQKVIEEAGHICILLPKFHCELNPIEMYWGYAKQRYRKLCNGSFPVARKLVPECLDLCPVTTIRRFFQKTWRFMDAYRQGLTGLMAANAVKKFSSHRKLSKRVMMEVCILGE